MSNAINYAKYIIRNGLDTNHNTYDGNMKLQKLLFFADYISLKVLSNSILRFIKIALSN